MRPDDKAPVPVKNLPIGKILKEGRRKAKLSQQDLADMLGVTRNTVTNWEADKNKPDYNYIPPICSILSIPLQTLFSMKTDDSLNPMERRIIGNLRLLNHPTQRSIDKMLNALVEEQMLEKEKQFKENTRVIFISPGSAAAGTGDTNQENPSYTFVRLNNVNDQADGIIKVSGESMEPVYHDGSFVYYKNARTALPGEDVIVDTDEGTVIKRMNTDLTLFSVNPKYPYPKKYEDNSLVIRGVVLGPVYSSDRLSREDRSLAEELLADEVAELKEEYDMFNWD